MRGGGRGGQQPIVIINLFIIWKKFDQFLAIKESLVGTFSNLSANKGCQNTNTFTALVDDSYSKQGRNRFVII